MSPTIDSRDIPNDLKVAEALILQDIISTSLLASSTTIFFYYCLIHLDKEVEYIWSRQWNVGKVMYLLTRYSGALFLGSVTLYTAGFGWSAQTILNNSHFGLYVSRGTQIFKFIISILFIILGPVIMILTEIILQMRVYAIYGRKKWIIVLSVIMNLASAAVCALQFFGFSYILSDMACKNDKFACSSSLTLSPSFQQIDDIGLASASLNLSPSPMATLVWVIFSIIELTLFALVARKANYLWCYREKKHSKSRAKTPDIMAVIARDSTSYFAIVFSVAVVGLIASVIAETINLTALLNAPTSGFVYLYRLLNAYEAIAIAITTILAPRMLINIRLEVYHQQETGSSASMAQGASTFCAIPENSVSYPYRSEGESTSFA
ncbi:hypothetical protein PNOK_0877100 [Pyrrhoderma noxium]|uniref:DUF6533 domain-containing protein n=1 Tax=Pyrrhoderma noxium TaxID=2282107 RepID=A0A286U8I8_9AGAM|nr:hypothetical protein PNOK_0877100 [Pyrrhoderma noxium]